ncbi:MAG: hypothetical protein ACREUR_04935, partial [Nitrosospira sp.]
LRLSDSGGLRLGGDDETGARFRLDVNGRLELYSSNRDQDKANSMLKLVFSAIKMIILTTHTGRYKFHYFMLSLQTRRVDS